MNLANEAPALVERTLDVNGYRTFARTSPGPDAERLPVVLIHGQGVSSFFVAPSGRELARSFPVEIPDQPGFGRSAGPTQALDVDGLGDFIGAYLAARGIPRAVLVGTSFGCQVAVACAARHPELVAKLVLQGPAAAPADRGAMKLVYLWWQNGRQEPTDMKLLAAEYRAAGFRRVYDTFNHYRRYPIEKVLRRVEVPTLIVRGADDKLVSEAWAERLAQAAPSGRLALVLGAAHTMSRFWPVELAQATEDFILDGGGEP